ncbi:MAG: ribbon-helix-helix domain-containing protein [Caulobacteraceae bacterium]|nr:ribbon-helix-helix domain-containing protein [Caulobacteraceae bacterium]
MREPFQIRLRPDVIALLREHSKQTEIPMAKIVEDCLIKELIYVENRERHSEDHEHLPGDGGVNAAR